MADALTSRQVSSFGRSLSSGRVYAKFEFSQRDVDALVEDLNYAALPGTIESAANIRETGKKVLQFLKDRFPGGDANPTASKSRFLNRRKVALAQRINLNLRAGWRVQFYSAALVSKAGVSSSSSLLGFYISHRYEESARIRTIIASLESGSRAYTIRPVNGKALAFMDGQKAVFADHANIPARPGYGFLNATEDYADQLLAANGSFLQDELQNVIEKGKRLREQNLSEEAANSSPASAVSAAISAISSGNRPSTPFARQSPLKRFRTLKARMASRRYSKSFR